MTSAPIATSPAPAAPGWPARRRPVEPPPDMRLDEADEDEELQETDRRTDDVP